MCMTNVSKRDFVRYAIMCMTCRLSNDDLDRFIDDICTIRFMRRVVRCSTLSTIVDFIDRFKRKYGSRESNDNTIDDTNRRRLTSIERFIAEKEEILTRSVSNV